jgi:4'-phosphopantetheinyl transferase
VLRIQEISRDILIGLLDLRAFAAHEGFLLKREIEKQGTVFLLDEMMKGRAYKLEYTAENKPFFKGNNDHLSISHSHDQLAIIINKKENTGIDIELVRDKILRVRHKYLNDAEQAFAGTHIENLISIWGAKEAMYKAYGLKGVDFREQMQVELFTGDTLHGEINAGNSVKRYLLKREKIEDYILVYILHEIQETHHTSR